MISDQSVQYNQT